MKSSFFSHQFGCSLLLFTFLLVTTDSRIYGEVEVLARSPNSTYVARGEPLKLKVSLNITALRLDRNCFYFSIRWYFRRFLSTTYEQVLSVTINGTNMVQSNVNVSRFSAMDYTSLFLVNTTLNDSGTYRFSIDRICSRLHVHIHYPELFFNATIVDEPKAEITCPSKIKLTERMNFSCWCRASGLHLVPSAFWSKSGKVLGDPVEFIQQLSLVNVSKDAAGTYICRAQLYRLMDEKSTEIIINYSPRIVSFQNQIMQNHFTKLRCHATGFPEPSYAIHDSAGKKLPEVINGEVMVGNFCEIINTSYTCIASNNLGRDQRRLNFQQCPCAEAHKSSNKKFQWYFLVISLLVGIIFGLGLAYVTQCVLRRKAMAAQPNIKEIGLRTGFNNNMGMTIPSDVVTQPEIMASSSSDYAELSGVRDKDDNVYENLHTTFSR